jgi:2-methylcitrate dehydratase PrpD
MTTCSQRLAGFVADSANVLIPQPVRRAAALHAIDALGCGLAATALGEGLWATASALEARTTGPAATIGVGHGLPEGDAAFVNGTLCHALDFDDTDPDSVVHVSAAVTPAALAAGQSHGATGGTFLRALVVGNEVSVRIGAAAGGVFHARGFHPTGVCGVFGATAAAAVVRGLDATTTAHAFGIAGSMASGLLEFLSDGAETKRLHPGWAAQAGLAAARLAAHGATGPTTVFEGARGYFATYLHGAEFDLDAQLADLGTRWQTPQIAFKPYPACHYVHAPVDALARIQRETGVRAEEVESIVAYSDATGVGLVLEPAADKRAPRTPYDAKFSLPYCLATQLVRGEVNVASFVEGPIADPEVLALASRVGYELRQYSPQPDAFGGGVRVSTTDGRTFEAELRHQRGGAENPLTDAEVLDKYRTNAALALDDADVAALEQAMLGLEEHAGLAFADVLGRARSAVLSPTA